MILSLRRLFICLAAVIISSSNGRAQSAASADGPAFSFKETVHYFGKIPEDSSVQCRFEFVNSGKSMLIINDITLSCPCFAVNWSRGPIMPGQQGWVSVDYPTKGHVGRFDDLIWIVSNATNNTPILDRYELRISGEVAPQHTATIPRRHKARRRAR